MSSVNLAFISHSPKLWMEFRGIIMTNSLQFLPFANELLINSQLNFFFSKILLAFCVLIFVYIKWKHKSHFSLQCLSFIVLKSDHLKVPFLYRSSLQSVLLLWTLATRDVSCYFCHAPTPSCTIHNYWHLDSHSTNFHMAPSINFPGNKRIYLPIKIFRNLKHVRHTKWIIIS